MKKIFKNNKRRQNTNIKFSYYRKYRNIKEIIEKRYNILIGIIILLNLIIVANLFLIQVIRNEHYTNRVKLLNQNIVLGVSAPRGRIYDRHHRLIVDNKPIKVIYYKKANDITRKEELKMAYEVADILDLDYRDLTTRNLKEFWLRNNHELGISKITDEEWKKLDERKLTLDDIEELKLMRITEEELNEYKELDKKAAYIYYLMNRGYYYSEKTIKKDDISDHEYAKISENIHKLRGFNTRLDWERVYPYGDTFKTILGSVSTNESGLPYELKDYYLAKGYSLDDRVGISYLEYQYEDYLKGEKNTYELLNDGSSKLLKEGKRGNDIVITIDIELQQEIDKILETELRLAKKEPNTEYYNRSFVVITDPKTGEILAMSSKQIVKDGDEYKVYDYTPGVINSSVVMGSVVKGASNIVGFNQGVVKVGEIRDDHCIKIASTPQKCSWRYLGRIDDVAALKYSSNSYQYQTAIKIGQGKYVYNQPLSINEKAFDTYRNTFAEFGLGVKTRIDLPNEGLGYQGNSTLSGHLLDFSIGQYDTYTPIQLSQYIGTIANGGYRITPHLLKSVYEPTKDGLTNIVYNREPEVLNKLTVKEEHLERIQEGFKQVVASGGTGVGYIPPAVKPAGKTGTSESFIDSDLDGIVDLETYSHTFAGYAPYDDPIVAFAVISPDISPVNARSGYRTTVNRRISYAVSKKFFEIYK
ncbi:MAG: penicillin-binding protein 2 [Bacilli bacterium]|nr:penicillin-binding protein 2 [Bacilli bacterium]